MSRKRTHRKHRPGMHPLDAITANQPFPPSELLRIVTKIHDAFERLRAGTDDVDMFDRMAAVLNVGLVRCESIGQAGVEVFKAAQAGLMEADGIFGRHGKYGFTGPGLEAVRQAVALYEEVLQASTPLQMAKVQEECMRRLRAGQYDQAAASTQQAAGRSA